MKIKHNPIKSEKRLQEEIIGGTENPKSNYFITEEKKFKVRGTKFLSVLMIGKMHFGSMAVNQGLDGRTDNLSTVEMYPEGVLLNYDCLGPARCLIKL